MLTVVVTSPAGTVFEGTARRAIFPGEQGTFEVLPLHRPLMSRLLAGRMIIDRQAFAVRRGAVHIADDVVTAIVELAG